MKLGLIAGNGRFRFCCSTRRGRRAWPSSVAAIREETDPEIDRRAAADERITVHWLSLGELSRLIETFHKEGVTNGRDGRPGEAQADFSSIRPDWRLAKLLLNLRTRNTDMLLGAVAKVLGDEGIELISSTAFLSRCWPGRRLTRARRTRKSARTSSTAWAWRGPWPASTLARRWWWPRRPAWPSRPWKARTRPLSAPGS
jgi:DUF1009 family protein